MADLRETVLRFFATDEWPLEEHPEQHALSTGFAGPNGQWRCIGRFREEEGQFVFFSLAPVQVAENTRPVMAEFLTRVNYGLVLGNFEMDYSDGELRYKTAIDVEGVEPSVEMVRKMVYANLWHMNHYLPGILAVQAGLAADKAVELVDAGGLAANAESAPGAPVEGD